MELALLLWFLSRVFITVATIAIDLLKSLNLGGVVVGDRFQHGASDDNTTGMTAFFAVTESKL